MVFSYEGVEIRMENRLVRLGAAVRHRRRLIGLTQDELGKPHVSKSFISQLEQGTVAPSLETLFHISDTLRMPAPNLLAISDPRIAAEAAFDMLEAAFLLGGRAQADKWLRTLEDIVPMEQLNAHGLGARWNRYVGLNKLAEGKFDMAVTMFEAAAYNGGVTTDYWLGLAHQRAGHLLQALRTWERVVGLSPQHGPRPESPKRDSPQGAAGALILIQAVTWGHLVSVYDRLGEPQEADRARAQLRAAIAADPGICLDKSSEPGGLSEASDGMSWGPSRVTTWHRACRFLAGLLWTEAERAWHNDDVLHAAGLARLVPPLLSTEPF